MSAMSEVPQRTSSFHQAVSGREKDASFGAYRRLLHQIPIGRVRQGKLAKDIKAAAMNIFRARGKPDDRGFSDGLWGIYSDWVKRVEERYNKPLSKIKYMHEEYYEEAFWILTHWYDEYQFTDTYRQETEQYVPPFMFTPCGAYRFETGEFSLIRNGSFAVMVGANGSGKSNFMAWLGLEFAKAGIHVITNLKYYRYVDEKNDHLYVTDKFSEMLKQIARILMEDHHAQIAVIIDEMDSFMNAQDTTLQLKQRSYMLKVIWQMRKLNVTLIGNFKHMRDVDIRYRRKRGTTGGNVLCRIYKGGYPNYESNEVGYFSEQYILKRSAFLRFDSVDILIDKIPDMVDEYFHGQPTDLEWDVDVLQMLAVMRKIPRPYSADEDKAYYSELGTTLLDNIDSWICGMETAILSDEEEAYRRELEEEVHAMVVKTLQIDFIIKKRAEGMPFKDVTNLTNEVFDTDLSVPAVKMRVKRHKKGGENDVEK